MPEDIRWKQRFDNYLRAFQTLCRAVELASQRDLSELEQQGLVQGFEYTHELAWKVLKDYMEEQTGCCRHHRLKKCDERGVQKRLD